MELHTLSPNKGARKSSRRLGRGEGSGVGKTSGKGHKGQKARTGASIPAWFEGGQMPLYRRIRKIGFRSFKKRSGANVYLLVSLSALNSFSEGETVDLDKLAERGIVCSSNQAAGVKVVANGTLEKKLTVKVDAVTKTAQKAIEEKGGSVELTAASTTGE